MTILHQFREFLEKATLTTRMNASHISVYTALCLIGVTQERESGFFISRRKVMQLACIRSSGTYHKNIRDLQAWGLVTYSPSYHPALGSTVSLIVKK